MATCERACPGSRPAHRGCPPRPPPYILQRHSPFSCVHCRQWRHFSRNGLVLRPIGRVYVSCLIRTPASMPHLSSSHCEVRPHYSSFSSLHSALHSGLGRCVVPPLADCHSLAARLAGDGIGRDILFFAALSMVSIHSSCEPARIRCSAQAPLWTLSSHPAIAFVWPCTTDAHRPEMAAGSGQARPHSRPREAPNIAIGRFDWLTAVRRLSLSWYSCTPMDRPDPDTGCTTWAQAPRSDNVQLTCALLACAKSYIEVLHTQFERRSTRRWRTASSPSWPSVGVSSP